MFLSSLFQRFKSRRYQLAKKAVAKRTQALIDGLSSLKHTNDPFYQEAIQAEKVWKRHLKRLEP
jgi:hypothetical protein